MVAFHLDPETGRYNNARLSGAIDEIAGPIMTRVLELREDLEAEPVRDPRQAARAAGKLQEADDLTARLRGIADAVSAAALSTAGQPADALTPVSMESKVTPNDSLPKTALSHHSNAPSVLTDSTPGSRAPTPNPSAPCIGPWSSPKSCVMAASTPSSVTPRSWAAKS